MYGIDLKLIGAAIAAVVIVLLGWQLKAAVERNGELEAKLETQAEQAREAADANISNLDTIGTLQRRIAAMVEQRRVEAAERERILDERDQELARARALADRLERERQDERLDNRDCAELSSLSIEAFCPTAGSQLRVRSRGPGGNRDTDGG